MATPQIPQISADFESPSKLKKYPFENEVQKSMWELMQLLKTLNNLVNSYGKQEAAFKSKTQSNQLDNLMDLPLGFFAQIEVSGLRKITREAQSMLELMDNKKVGLDKYSEHLKSISANIKEDPLFEKVLSLTKQVQRLEKLNRSLESRIEQLSDQQNVNLKLQEEMKGLNLVIQQNKQMEILLKEQTLGKEQEIEVLKRQLEEANSRIESGNEKVIQLEDTLEYYGFKGVLEKDTDTLLEFQSLEKVLKTKKISKIIISFLTPSELNELCLSSKPIYSLIRTSPGLISSSFNSINYDPRVIEKTLFSSYLDAIRLQAISNKTYITKALKHHLHYDFNVLDLVELSVQQSLINIQHFKRNFLDQEEKEQVKNKSRSPTRSKRETKLFGAFKMLLKKTSKDDNINPEEEQDSILKVTKLPEIPLDLQGKVNKLVQGSVFENMYLMDMTSTKPGIEPAEFREKQEKFYRQDAEEKAAQFMLEFNSLVNAAGKKLYFLKVDV